MSELHTTCLCARVLELYNEYANLQFFARTEIVDNVPKSEFWRWSKYLGLANEIYTFSEVGQDIQDWLMKYILFQKVR